MDVLGESRVNSFAKKWRKRYREDGMRTLQDTRKHGSGRPRKTERTPEEEIKRLESRILRLEQEKEL